MDWYFVHLLFALMSIIVASKKKEMEALWDKILELQQAIRPLQSTMEFTDLDKRLNDMLNHLEHEVITNKKEKMLTPIIYTYGSKGIHGMAP